MEPVGFSTRHGEVPVQRAVDGGPGASPLRGDLRSTTTRLAGPFLSRGHAERFEVVLWANPSAAAAWQTGDVMPEGAMLVEQATERDRLGPRPAGSLVMEKTSGAWTFAVVGTAGEWVDDTRVAACADCHRDAPHDDVFAVSGEEGDQ
jgi:hypothetical protein